MITKLLISLALIGPQVDSVDFQFDTLSAAAVIADRLEKSVPSQTLRGEKLQNLSTTTVADALKFFAGVQIKDYGGLGGQKTIDVRSLGFHHVGVYLDGVKITNTQNGMVDLGKYSLTNMESISVYNLNKNELLMTASEYASAATVYLQTKRPEKTSIQARYSYGSFSTHKGLIHTTLKNIAFLDVEAADSRGNYPFTYKSEYEDTTGVRNNSDVTYFRAEAGGYTDHFSTHIYVYSAERGMPGGIVRRLSDKYQDVGRETDFNMFAQATYKNRWGHHGLKYNVKATRDYSHYNTCFIENNFAHYDTHYTQFDVYNGLSYSFTEGPLVLTIAPDFRWSNLQTNVKGYGEVNRYDFKAAFSAGYRSSTFNASVVLLYTFVKDKLKVKEAADELSRWSPSFNISYTFDNSLTLRAFYKEIFRVPTLNDLYYTSVGARTLKPENTKQFDLGFLYKNDFVEFQGDFYHNEIWDKIVCIPQGGSYNWRMYNRGRIKTDGVDFTAKAVYKGFYASLTGSVQSVRDVTDPNDPMSYNRQFLYCPPLSLTAVVGYEHKWFSISISHLYCEERNWSYASAKDFLPSYNNTDLRVILKPVKHLEVTFDLNDVFDVRYELIQRWPLPGRRFTVTTSLNF